MDVALIWATYFLIVLVVYLFLSTPAVGWHVRPAVAFFIGLIVGLIYVLLWWFLYNRSLWSTRERNSMVALIIVAVVLAILDLFFMLWALMRCKPECEPECPPKCKPKCPPKPKCAPEPKCDSGDEYEEEVEMVKSKIRCDTNGQNCKPVKTKLRTPHSRTTVLYD